MNAPCALTGSRQLDELAGIIGVEAALKVSAKFRGLRIFILKHYNDHHPMVASIGRAAADALSEHLAGTTIVVPKTAGLKSEVYRLADRGELTRHEIAAHLHIDERQVYRWLDERRRTQQPDLFAVS